MVKFFLHNVARHVDNEAVTSSIIALKQTLKDQDGSDDLTAFLLLLNSKNEQKYTPLHLSIFHRNENVLKAFAMHGADLDTKCYFIPPIHLILNTMVLPGGFEFAFSCLEYLLSTDKVDYTAKLLMSRIGVDSPLLQATSRIGWTPLHYCAPSDASELAFVLVKSGAALEAKTPQGYTALHLSVMNGSHALFDLLCSNGASTVVVDGMGRSLTQLQTEYHFQSHGDSRTRLSSPRTAIVTHPLCLQHHTCPPSSLHPASYPTRAPPENLHRLSVLTHPQNGILRSGYLQKQLLWVEEAPAATLSDVLRVHEWSYVRHLQAKCDALDHDANREEGMDSLDSDTTFSRESFRAALRAAGAVCHGVDMVCEAESEIRTVFCPVRPPGHHAGPRGLVRSEHGGDSHGFCFLNNVSIAAAHALSRHPEIVRRVAIVDFDVHHGNGTEETVRWLKPGLDTTEVVSHSYFGCLEVPRYKPWFDADDPDNVLFVSLHGYGPKERELEHLFPLAAFYPGTGRTVCPDIPPSPRRTAKTTEANADEDASKPYAGKNGTRCVVKDEPGVSVVGEGKPTTDSSRGTAPCSASGNSLESVYGESSVDDMGTDASMLAFPGDVSRESADEEDGGEGFEEADEEDSEDEDGDWEGVDGSSGGGEGSEDGLAEETRKRFSLRNNKIQELRRIYSAVDGRAAKEKPSRGRVRGEQSQPLILDIGLGLPEEETMTALAYRHRWRTYVREEVFPRLLAFAPDLILISAGFDAHRRDGINCGYLSLVEEDYEWITTQLVRIAANNVSAENQDAKESRRKLALGRVVSVLEGGYMLGGEHCSAFAKSVAAHVTALVRGVTAGVREVDTGEGGIVLGKCFDPAEDAHEALVEKQLIEAEDRRRREREERKLEARTLYQQLQQGVLSPESASERDDGKSVSQAEDSLTQASASEPPVVEPSSAVEEDAGGGHRKRRRAAAKVDYVALDAELSKKERTSSG